MPDQGRRGPRPGRSLRRYLAFVAIGSFFATVEEFLTVVVIRGDFGGYLFTLLILFPIYLTLMFLAGKLVDRLIRHEPGRGILHFFLGGLTGLSIEWFLIGLSPWSDPAANPLLMLIFQLGMFSFWATVGFAPRLFLDPRPASRGIRRGILIFYVPYFLFVYFVALVVPESLKFVALIALIVLGYLSLNLFYLVYFVRSALPADAAVPG